MNTVALTLVLVAAVLHPTWNLLAKRATQGDPIAFVWITSVLSVVLYVPIVAALVIIARVGLGDVRVDAAMMLGSGFIHSIYFVLLQRGYRIGAFSIVYPIARGTGPIVTALAALALFGEHLAPVQWAAVAIIAIAVFVIAGGRVDERSEHAAAKTVRRSIGYGIVTGIAIAAYTLWDKQSVSILAISPILYDFGRTLGQALLLGPIALYAKEKRGSVAMTWRLFPREAIGVAILSPLAYVLILYALTEAPVSVVAPLRESGIIVGAFIGAHFLREGQLRRRIVAASLVLVGIVALTRG